MTDVSFSIIPRAEAAVLHCRSDIDCVLYMKNCPYYRICGPQDICICYKKEEATSNANEITPK